MDGDITLPEASLPSQADLPLDDYNYLSNYWAEPWSGTSTDSFPITGEVPSYNSPGDLPSAIANQQLGGTVTPGQQSSFLSSISDAFDQAMKDVTSGLVKVGTASAKGAIGQAIGSANPGPMNSNTNMANKSLLQQAQSMQQALLGGLLKDSQGKTNYWIVGGMVLAIVLIILKLTRG